MDSVLIVGLGNPGEKYEETRHNAGFLTLDYCALRLGLQMNTQKMQGVFGTTRLSENKVFFLKPQTFMNRSGECVQSFMKYFDITLENILVVHDDLDLAPGRVKIVQGGGAGGHNGIRSLIQHLGTKDFARLKIGIGHPRDNAETAQMPVEKFVLSRFSNGEWKMFQDNQTRIADGIDTFIESGVLSAMNLLNQKTVQE